MGKFGKGGRRGKGGWGRPLGEGRAQPRPGSDCSLFLPPAARRGLPAWARGQAQEQEEWREEQEEWREEQSPTRLQQGSRRKENCRGGGARDVGWAGDLHDLFAL